METTNLIDITIENITRYRNISKELSLREETTNTFNNNITSLTEIKSRIKSSSRSAGYLAKLNEFLQHILYLSDFGLSTPIVEIQVQTPELATASLEKYISDTASAFKSIELHIDFFSKLDFFNSNIVAIGANGSGKTSLSVSLKNYLSNNGIVISAQKILVMPTFGGISNLETTSQKLKNVQVSEKSHKVTYSSFDFPGPLGVINDIANEFHILLDNLLAERNAARNKFFEELKSTKQYQELPQTKLDRALEIWNNLLPHRKISCPDGINIILTPSEGEPYPAFQMSDGEKVVLFLVAQTIQAPSGGYIVVDEPEMFLHKTIINKLWDTLEAERKDCIFIYLTHDLDFATSRVSAKKLWIKSFEFPDKWTIEPVPENDLPEELLLELLGSRKDILFCEGKKLKSLDEKIYNILFPHLTICAVESCFDVIHHTKAFNRIRNISINAYGIIDRDHHNNERLNSLESQNVFSFAMAEIENLFLDEAFLNIIAARLFKGQAEIEEIKAGILKKLEEDQESQISNYISTKINYHFHDSHVSQGNTLSQVKSNLERFIADVNLDKWHETREEYVNKIITEMNYSEALKIYNNKGLKSIANRHLGIKDLSEMSINLLASQPEAREILKKHFPEALHS